MAATSTVIDARVIEEGAGVAPSEVCPECGDAIGARGGSSAKMQLGLHRRRQHGVAGKAPGGRKGGRRTVREDAPTAMRILKEAAAEIPDGTRPPTEVQLQKAFGRVAGTLSTLAASYFAETDPTLSPTAAQAEAERDAIVDYLSFSPEAAQEFAYPFARAFGHSRWNKRHGRTIVDNVDMVSAAGEGLILAIHYRRYLSTRRVRVAAMESRRVVAEAEGVVHGPVVPPAQPTYYPPPGSGEPATGGPGATPMTGHVVDAEEVQRILRQRGQGR